MMTSFIHQSIRYYQSDHDMVEDIGNRIKRSIPDVFQTVLLHTSYRRTSNAMVK